MPVSLFGVKREEDLLLLTRSGRGTRWPVRALDISGTQVVNCGKEDRVRLALPVQNGEEVVLVTEDGYGRRLLPEWLPVPDRPESKSALAYRPPQRPCRRRERFTWAITAERIMPVAANELPLANSTKTEPAVTLPARRNRTGTFLPPGITGFSPSNSALDNGRSARII